MQDWAGRAALCLEFALEASAHISSAAAIIRSQHPHMGSGVSLFRETCACQSLDSATKEHRYWGMGRDCHALKSKALRTLYPHPFLLHLTSLQPGNFFLKKWYCTSDTGERAEILLPQQTNCVTPTLPQRVFYVDRANSATAQLRKQLRFSISAFPSS